MDLAVLLNANARQVSPKVTKAVSKVISQDHLYLSSNLEDAQSITRHIIDSGYRQVAAGGGDGTIARLIDGLCRYAEKAYKRGVICDDLPEVAVLRLGTGNALASHVGASNFEKDLQRLASNPMQMGKQQLALLEAEGRLSFFAGVGLDAMIANDYADIRKGLQMEAIKRFWAGLGGYWGSVFVKTIPRLIVSEYPEVKVVNNGPVGYSLHPKTGAIKQSFGKGDVMYQGPCLIACTGTLPYYGFGMKMFPHALSRPGFFHLRVASPGIVQGLMAMPAVWKGNIDLPSLEDFHCTDVSLSFNKPVPFQVAGDPEGWRTEVRFKTYPKQVPLVDFRQLPPPEIQ